MRVILIGLALMLVSGPAWAETQQQRDWCYGDRATLDQTVEGCTALIQSAQETSATKAGAYDKRGSAYDNNGLYDQAIADETQSLALNPTDPHAYIGRGVAYFNKGLYNQAIADYTRVIALEPDYAYAYSDRGLAYANKGLYDQAIADCTRAIALKPDYAVFYQNRGFAYEKKGLRDAAVADYRAALKIEPILQRARDGLTRLGATP
jgi:tetratricopeptide (TPR) repeat protein